MTTARVISAYVQQRLAGEALNIRGKGIAWTECVPWKGACLSIASGMAIEDRGKGKGDRGSANRIEEVGGLPGFLICLLLLVAHVHPAVGPAAKICPPARTRQLN